jgi:hypothetical protein
MPKLFIVFKTTKIIRIFEFPSKNAKKINFFYDIAEFILVTEGGETAQILCGIEGREYFFKKTNNIEPDLIEVLEISNDGLINKTIWTLSLSDKAFISNLNFGEYFLRLSIDSILEPVGRILRTDVIGSNKASTYVYYENIVRYVLSGERSLIFNNLLKPKSDVFLSTSEKGKNESFSVVIQFASAILSLLRRLEHGFYSLPSKLVSDRKVIEYSEDVELDFESLASFLTDASNWSIAGNEGNLDFPIVPTQVNAPFSSETFDLPENRMFMNCVSQIRNDILIFTEKLGFRTEYLESLINDLEYYQRHLQNRYGISLIPEANHFPPLKYFNSQTKDVRLLGDLIQRWYLLGSADMKSESYRYIFSLYTTEVIWEYFCFEKIVKAFISHGFSQQFIDFNHIRLNRGEDTAYIYYDQLIHKGKYFGGITNFSATAVQPDFLVVIKKPSGARIGVFDAKFSPSENDWRSRGEEIWGKYGLWMRKQSGEVLDFVFALVPSVNNGVKNNLIGPSGNPSLSLGFLSLFMDELDYSGEKAISSLLGLNQKED